MEEEVKDNEEIRDPKAVLEALDRAKADAKRYREQFEELQTANKELETKIEALNGDEGIKRYKKQLVELHAKRELERQGLKDADRIFGLMDSESFDLDEEGRLVGFDENLSGLKERLPEVFDTKKRVAGGADAFATGDVAIEDPFRAAAKNALKNR